MSERSRLQWRKVGQGTSTYNGGNCCGPGWGFTYQDVLDGKIRGMPAAIDEIDAACKRHDECYGDSGYLTADCDLVLTKDLLGVISNPNSTSQKRFDAVVMAALFVIEGFILDPFLRPNEKTKALRDRISGLFAKGNATICIISIDRMSILTPNPTSRPYEVAMVIIVPTPSI